AAVIKPAQLLQAVVAVLPRQVIERVPEKVDVAALPCRFRDHLADRGDQPGMVGGDDQLDALEPARLELDEDVLPGRAALAIGHLDGQDLAPPVPVNADRDQYRLACHDAGFAYLFVASVEDEVGERLLKR